MPALFQWADLSISGGGITCWEMAFTGLPNIIFELADNQHMVAKTMAAAGCSINLGPLDAQAGGRLLAQLGPLMKNERRRREMSVNGPRLIDGLGTARVVAEMNAKTTTGR